MSIISRCIVSQYLRFLVLCLLAGGAVFLLADFFLRIEDFAGHDATAAQVLSYFVWKLPRIISEVYPAAALLGVLISMGLMSDRHEIIAMNACGTGTKRIVAPLLLTSLIVSSAAFVWNETVVPPTASRARNVKEITIKHQGQWGHLDARSLWFQGEAGFFNIDYFDAGRNIIFGLTVHELDDDFTLRRLVEIPEAAWDGSGWDIYEGTVTEFGPNGDGLTREIEPGEISITDTPVEFRNKRRRSYEFDFRKLKEQIAVLRAKGLDANEYLVDLHFKIALPFSGLIAVLIGFPIATRTSRRRGMAFNIALAMVVVFVYWMVMAVSVSAGHAGNLPPVVAAWAANALFTAIPIYFYATARR